MRHRPSPNFGLRRGGVRPDLVVIHYTAMDSAQAAEDRLCSPDHEVSAHWLIGADGALVRLVAEDLRAWHAGAGAWGAVTDINSRSIGIELANRGAEPFAHPQMLALEDLLRGITLRWGIPPARVIGHSDCAPGRKTDPGARFDWRRLALQGLAVWPAARTADPDPAGFMACLRTIGYTAEAPPDILTRAFRLRFRPWADGALTPGDMGAALDLADRFPADSFAVDPDICTA